MSTDNNIVLTPEEQLIIIRLPVKLRGTYITWRMGVDPYFTMSRETYYRHANELSKKYGIEIRKAFSL
jgi:hypothetical protein